MSNKLSTSYFCTYVNMHSSLFGHIKVAAGRIDLDAFQTLLKGDNKITVDWNLRSRLLTQKINKDCHQWQTYKITDVHVVCIALLSDRPVRKQLFAPMVSIPDLPGHKEVGGGLLTSENFCSTNIICRKSSKLYAIK